MTDELTKLREENEHLKYQVRQLTRKQTNPDMMDVDFEAHQETWGRLAHDEDLHPWAHKLWRDLKEARDAYQALDNFHNFFKSDICDAIEGAPEMTEEEIDEAEKNNNGYTARIRKCVVEVQRLQQVVELSADPKLLRMAYEPGNPLEMDLEPNWAVKALAYSFRNTFNDGGEGGKPPANYLSVVVKIPEDNIDLEIIVQKTNGERPAEKANRYKEGLQEAWNILNDWEFGRRGDSLDKDTREWTDHWEPEFGQKAQLESDD